MTQKEKAEAIKKQLVVINQLLKKPENKLCADCKRTSPTWASVNLGVFVCINCSGCHREIGVHVTKIRSTNLDVWPQDVLDNFKIINNKIANKYWECKLKKFNFKSLHSDNYKLVQFIRDKYEYKKWVDPSKKEDPMTLIIKGKIKKYKKLYCEDEDLEEEEENENEENEKKSKKKKKSESFEENENSDEEKPKKKKKSKKTKNKEEDDEEDNNDEEEDNNNDENEEEFEEVQDKKVESKSPNIQRPPQQINNIFLNLNPNPNPNQQNNLNLNFNNNNNNDNNPVYSNSDNNLIDIFSVQTQNDKKSQDLINNINNAYSPQPSHSGFTNLYQQMPNNMGLNLQNKNNMQNMGMNNNNILNINRVHSTQNMNMNLNNNFLNVNKVHSMQNMNMNTNNNMFNQNQMNNNMFNQNQMNNNMNFGMNNNMNFNNNNNNNINNNNNNNNIKHTYSTSNTNPSFNMEYFNQNMNNNKKDTGSTYNFAKKKVDPFKSLVSFDK